MNKISLTGSRRQVRRGVQEIRYDKRLGLISNVKLTRIGFRVWILELKVESK